MAKIKLIACDMDGTLLDNSKEIPAENIEAVKLAKEAGVYFVIATGRHDSMIKAYLDVLHIEMPVISCNGGMVREPFADKVFSLHPLTKEQILGIIESAKSVNADYHIYCHNTIYGEQVSGKISYYIERNRRLQAHEQIKVFTDPDYKSFIKNTEEEFFKVLVLQDDPEKLALAKERIDNRTGLIASQSDKNLIDIMQTGITKAGAMSELCDKLGIKQEETAAVGDQLNDFHMIEWAGTGVAVANAVPAVKEIAQLVTEKTNHEGGVAEAIKKLLTLR